MNHLSKSFSERLKTGTGVLKSKAGEAIKAVQENMDQQNQNHNDADPNNFEESAISPPSDNSFEMGDDGSGRHKPNFAANIAANMKGISFPKFEEKEIVVTDIAIVLSELFDFDPRAKKQHEMVEALELEGINSWRAFLLMAEEDIATLQKKGEVPIAKNSVRMLTYLKQFAMYNINNNVENARNPGLYTREAFDGFVEDLQLGRKTPGTKEDEEGQDDSKPKRNIRQSLTGFASRLKPGARVEDGSLADILVKAKAKVLRKKDGAGEDKPGDEVSVDEDGSVVSDLGAATADGNTLEDMKKNVDDLASKLKMTTTDTAGKTKEEVQKLMVPLLLNLKKSQDKFGAMVEARKKKMAEKKAARIAAGESVDEDEEPSENNDDEDKYKHLFDDDTSKLKNLLSNAEKATMKAFHDAEQAARQAARKAGILDGGKESGGESTAVPGEAVASP